MKRSIQLIFGTWFLFMLILAISIRLSYWLIPACGLTGATALLAGYIVTPIFILVLCRLGGKLAMALGFARFCEQLDKDVKAKH